MALNHCFIFTTAFRFSSPAISVLIGKTVVPASCALLQQGLGTTTRTITRNTTRTTTRTMSTTFKKVQVVKLTSDFGAATEIKEEPVVPPGGGEVRVKNAYSGVNATDINISAGRYFTDGKVPFDVGFEGLGVIDAIGSSVTGGFTVGQNVLYIGSKGFSEVIYAKPEELVPVPDPRPEYIATLVCGLTAAIGLDVAGLIKPGEKVLITAAAGGTGHIAVQWAKSKGCHVIGLTSSREKADFLKSIGADDIINYKTEDLDQELTNKYPEGVDVVWETIGGKTLEILSRHLALRGRLVIVGGITGYKTVGFAPADISSLPARLLMGSQSMTGFLLTNERHHFQTYLPQLITMVATGKLVVKIDLGNGTADGPFKGIKDVVRAVEHLHSGRNQGKVIVQIN